jgi:hypothetical protein
MVLIDLLLLASAGPPKARVIVATTKIRTLACLSYPKRHLCEFNFRYNEREALDVSDAERAVKAIKGAIGKMADL